MAGIGTEIARWTREGASHGAAHGGSRRRVLAD
jgi:hypothetical protein